jgi:hypothetical protein
MTSSNALAYFSEQHIVDFQLPYLGNTYSALIQHVPDTIPSFDGEIFDHTWQFGLCIQSLGSSVLESITAEIFVAFADETHFGVPYQLPICTLIKNADNTCAYPDAWTTK